MIIREIKGKKENGGRQNNRMTEVPERPHNQSVPQIQYDSLNRLNPLF
jgi:hypothetical protein